MKISVSYIFLLILIIAVDAYAQYNVKKHSITNNWFYICLAIVSYTLVCLLLSKCYNQHGGEIGITNLIWSVFSIISIIIIGLIAFHETITKYDIIGIVLCFTGLYFIFMYGH